MGVYLEAVTKQLSNEYGGGAAPLLGPLLKDNNWWLRAIHAPRICGMLKISCAEPSYYRDVYVWLPDVRWGQAAMPICPGCKSARRVGAHCWRDNHFGRKIKINNVAKEI